MSENAIAYHQNYHCELYFNVSLLFLSVQVNTGGIERTERRAKRNVSQGKRIVIVLIMAWIVVKHLKNLFII